MEDQHLQLGVSEVGRGEPDVGLEGRSADDGRDRVGRVARLNRWCTADARAVVDGQAGWKGRRNRARGRRSDVGHADRCCCGIPGVAASNQNR